MPVRNFSNSYLSECLTLELTISNKKSYVATLYRSPSQTSDEFDSFISHLEKLLISITSSDPHFVILLGDFNAKSKSWSIVVYYIEVIKTISNLFIIIIIF